MDIQTVDRLCDDFEKQLRAGSIVSVEKFLTDTAIESPDTLILELLRVEAEFASESNQLSEHIATDVVQMFEDELRSGSDPEVGPYLARIEADDCRFATRIELLRIRRRYDSMAATTAGDTHRDRQDDLRFLKPSDDPDSMGRLQQYEILSIVGRGGLGVVLKARDTRLDRIVAIKVPASEYAANGLAKQRFLREAKAAAAVSHDHVVTIHAVDEAEGIPFLVMELVVGVSLQDKINADGALPLKEILRIGMQTAAGLAAAHKQGLVHRDVKPANILLENGIQRVKLTDFGLARAVDDVSMTQTGTVAGTPQYMSPEQAHGDTVDHRSDMFSFGSVLYAMCTGRAAFRARSTPAVLRRVCEEEPKPVCEVNEDLPQWLSHIVDKLLAKDVELRFQTATEVEELLGQYLAHLQEPSTVPLPKSVGAMPHRASSTPGKLRIESTLQQTERSAAISRRGNAKKKEGKAWRGSIRQVIAFSLLVVVFRLVAVELRPWVTEQIYPDNLGADSESQDTYNGKRQNIGPGRPAPFRRQSSINAISNHEIVFTTQAREETASVWMAPAVRQGVHRRIVFVMDMSKSMSTRRDDGKRRFEERLDALESIVNNSQFDEETSVGLRVFGHRIRYEAVTKRDIPNPDYKRLFGRQIPAYVTSNADVSTEFPLRRMDANGKEEFLSVLKKLRMLGPWGISPLGQAITHSLLDEDGLYGKPGIVIAMTDGVPTDMGRDGSGRPDPRIANFTPELKHAIARCPASKVAIVACDFEKGGNGRRILEDIFLTNCGIADIVDASDSTEMVSRTCDEFQPATYTISGPKGKWSLREEGGPLKSLSPGILYNARFEDTGRETDFYLTRGDRPMLMWNWQKRVFNFIRRSDAKVYQPVTRQLAKYEIDAPSMLRLVDSKPVGDSELAAVTDNDLSTLEIGLMLDHDQPDRPVRQPAEIEFTISPHDDTLRSYRIEQRFTPEWGAPGWVLKISDWPGDELFDVDAFWKMERTTPEQIVSCQVTSSGRKTTVGGVGSLQEMKMSITLQPDGTLEVWLHPAKGIGSPATRKMISATRIEIGEIGSEDKNAVFVPDEVTTVSQQTKFGLSCKLQGNYSAEQLAGKQIALTSVVAQAAGAYKLQAPLRVAAPSSLGSVFFRPKSISEVSVTLSGVSGHNSGPPVVKSGREIVEFRNVLPGDYELTYFDESGAGGTKQLTVKSGRPTIVTE